MHGDNTTNLHFHGGHVSPQPPADDVLLEIHPRPAGGKAAADSGTNGTNGTHAAHGRTHVAFGQFQYRFGELLWIQPEGTHWYHPHKHGSVALQVANGMPGAIIVEGPFDDWLNGYYAKQGQALAEKTLVLQLVQETLSLWGKGPSPAAGGTATTTAVLVNGQVAPTVTMQPGEVQRWRLLNATPQQALTVTMFLDAGATAKQIAMDGVRFAPENYQRQPLFDPANPSTFTLVPANRADFLVQAPSQPGTYNVRYKARALSTRAQERFRRVDEALAPGAALPPLVQVVVAAPAAGAAPAKVATGFPPVEQWPPMPDYLRDLPAAGADTLSLAFEMTVDGGGTPVGGDPTSRFFINDKRFDPNCVDVQTKLGSVADWTVTNNAEGGVPHTLHIHINPFQVLSNGTTTYQPPYPWQDTIGVPAPATGTPPPVGSNTVTLRQKYLDFTGEYVLHCHYLGHEDQGMMLAMQTVCPQDPTKFGKPDCLPGHLIPAGPLCPVPPSLAASPSSR
jgi:FtsP/CotA-like multicopper oxidase with cupredoxin domain